MKLFKKSVESGNAEMYEEIRRKISEAHMPQEVETLALQELDLLSRIGPSTAEYTIGLAYMEYLVTMPWNKKTEDLLDLSRAERILNEEHYGLRNTKERILEHLAVKMLRKTKGFRVLVIDDEEIARKNLVHILEKEKYEVRAASDGSEAMEMLKREEFDVVITDLIMPGVSGMEIVDWVRTRHPDTKVIMVTGHGTIPSAVEATKKGAFHYIAKPFKLDEIRDAVNGAVEDRAGRRSTKGAVLCFAGPPGTGKTSLGKSIAMALGRKFVRISLAGIRDEAEIRGHRRTYAGAMPGRIIDEIHRVQSANPVMMLDEFDKIGHDFKGDPASAFLEVLDPEQNRKFVDHYLDLPFDLSSVIFILTSNLPETIPAALRDRMEVIEFSGYTEEEKAAIAERFLVPKQISEKGLSEYPPIFPCETVSRIIREYTSEAGIRTLERRIAAICRKLARNIVQGNSFANDRVISPDSLASYLGRKRSIFESVEERERIGVATGLVRTEEGGGIIFVEAAMMKGKKELLITGSLGDVMRESALAALSYIRSNAPSFGIPEDFFEDKDIHIHIPSGAIQKDGPSAGITIVVALLSLLTHRPAKSEVAMSGEITLTGRLLPVGGVREKVLAAKRAGVKKVLVPSRNRLDVEELPDEIKNNIKVILVDSVSEVMSHALTCDSVAVQ